MKSDYAYPTSDVLEQYDGRYLRVQRTFRDGAIVHVGDEPEQEVLYRAREVEMCRHYCSSCAELLEWSRGYVTVYDLVLLEREEKN